MNLRRDHVGGGAFVVAGALVLAVSGDLPFGTLASPGAGMLPKLVVGLMMAFGAILLVRAGDSPPLAEVAWDDFPHAVRVIAVTAAGVAALHDGRVRARPCRCCCSRSPLWSSAGRSCHALVFSAGVTGDCAYAPVQRRCSNRRCRAACSGSGPSSRARS